MHKLTDGSQKKELMKVEKTKSLIELCVFCIFISLAFIYQAGAAETEDRLSQCSKIEKDDERLKCFDELAGKKAHGQANKQPNASATAAIRNRLLNQTSNL